MSNIFGLYFGNSTASIAQFRDDGKVEILANEAGERVTAAVVVLTNKEQVVGTTAGATSYSLAPLTVRNNKILLDTTLTQDEISILRSQSYVKIETDMTYNVFETDKKPLIYTPEQVASLIFKKLYGIGLGAAPGQKKLSCVISVPYHWTEESRNLTFKAASDAGWSVRQIINEPGAAVLAYKIGFEKPPIDRIVLVYRLGGNGCDTTLIQIQNGFQVILSHIRNTNIGGKDIVKALTDHLADEFKRKFRLDPNESRKSMWKLKIAASSILHSLSTLPSCSRFIESVCEGVDFNVTVSRARLDALITPLIPQLTSGVTESMKKSNITSDQVSKVILTGGALKIPKLKSNIASFFSCDICSNMNPDEVYATGAAQQAGLISTLSEKTIPESTMKIPFLTDPIYLKIQNKDITIDPLYLPTSAQLSLQIDDPSITVTASQKSELKHLQGETTLEFDSGVKDVEIHLRINLSDEIHIEAVDTKSKDSIKSVIHLR